jgi:hypothetical protein
MNGTLDQQYTVSPQQWWEIGMPHVHKILSVGNMYVRPNSVKLITLFNCVP